MDIIGPNPDGDSRNFTYFDVDENIESTFLARGSAADVWKVTGDASRNGHSSLVYISKIIRVTPEDFANYAHTKPTGSNKPSSNKISWGHFVQQCKEKALIWIQLTHRNVVKVYGLQPSLSICVEYCSSGSLREYLQDTSVEHPNKEKIICDILEGMEYMHSRDPPVVHGSLNAGKIFVDASGRTKIVVFTGFNRWMSPELFSFDSDSAPTATVASDIWALACTIFEVVSEKLPYPDYKHDIRVQRAILKGEPPGKFPETLGGTQNLRFWALVESCWSKDPLQRPSIKAILASYIEGRSPELAYPQLAGARGTREEVTIGDIAEKIEQVHIRVANEGMRERTDAVMEEFKKSLAAEHEAEKAHREAVAARKREQKKLQALIGEAMVDKERRDVERTMGNLQIREEGTQDEGRGPIGAHSPLFDPIIAPGCEVTSVMPGQPRTLSLHQPTSAMGQPVNYTPATSETIENTQDRDSQTVMINSANSKTLTSPGDEIDPELPSSKDPIMSPTTLRGHLEEMTIPSTRPLISSLLESARQTGDPANSQVYPAYSLFNATSVPYYGRFTGVRTTSYPLSHQAGAFSGLAPPGTSLHPTRNDESYAAMQTPTWSTHNSWATALPSPQPSVSGSGLPPPPRQNVQTQTVRLTTRSPKVTSVPLLRGLKSRTSWERYQESQLAFGFNEEGTDDEYDDDGERGKSNWSWEEGQRIHKHTPSFLDLRSRRQSQL